MPPELEPVPGTADICVPEVDDWVVLESAARVVFARYGYGEIRTPVFERTDVFVRSIGDETEVVQKEMYTFEDRGGRSLTLRPEGTAGVMRAIANKGLGQGAERRVFYMGPMFRGERPAAGRRRQFHQIGVEAVGCCTPEVDVECIAMLLHYLREIGIADGRVLLNTRGVAADHELVSAALQAHFAPLKEGLCNDCQRRLETNVWRILDCKNEACREAVRAAPRMPDLVGPESREFFARVCSGLDALGLAYEVDPGLVRGLDYYEHTVFEVIHCVLRAETAVAGGGRYRIGLPGVKTAIEGVGFAVGMERLLLVRESLGYRAADETGPDVFVATPGVAAVIPGLVLAQDLRARGLQVQVELGARSMKAQMRTAGKAGAAFVLIQGDAELAEGSVTCKEMASSTQQNVPRAEVVEWICRRQGTESS